MKQDSLMEVIYDIRMEGNYFCPIKMLKGYSLEIGSWYFKGVQLHWEQVVSRG